MKEECFQHNCMVVSVFICRMPVQIWWSCWGGWLSREPVRDNWAYIPARTDSHGVYSTGAMLISWGRWNYSHPTLKRWALYGEQLNAWTFSKEAIPDLFIPPLLRKTYCLTELCCLFFTQDCHFSEESHVRHCGHWDIEVEHKEFRLTLY